jgi:exonuclease III
MKTQQPKSPHFKLVHLNIRSLRTTAHLTQLKEFLSKTKTEALALSETWLNTTITNAEIDIEGYTLYRQDRLNKRGGGVCAYIRNEIKVSKLNEISSVSENYFHQLWLKLQSKKLKSIVICISYRPPECPLVLPRIQLKTEFCPSPFTK